MSIRKAKINRYKAEQLKKMKNDIKNMFKFFKEVKKSDEDDSLSDSLTSKESETDNLNSVKKDLYIQRRSSSQGKQLEEVYLILLVFTKPRRMSYIRTKSPVGKKLQLLLL
uniref:Uncharacterized protein n=2 Tax=Euplotes crassus TaxID=5936 RepID=A0A7S3K678_EUPCR|mmetsp:Transcript_11885/g.11866  ORF Transcript_11885/g.11866 Transcript_11885/m.11866 type:complete len:111 (+) Transcript_11885:386-718(+)